MFRKFCYPAVLTRDEFDAGFVVTFRDLPEAITQGDTVEEAAEQAADALEEAIAGRIRLGEEIPAPSDLRPGEHQITLPVETASKAALYLAIRESGLTKVQLAAILGCDEKEVRRLLDPHHPSKLPRIESALERLGKKLAVLMLDAEDTRRADLVRTPRARRSR